MRIVLVTVVTFAVFSCESPDPSKCVPNRAVECACPGGKTGVQTCQDDGIYEICACDPREGSFVKDTPKKPTIDVEPMPPVDFANASAKDLYRQAQPLVFRGDGDEALVLLKAALKKDPELHAALRSISVIHQRAGRKDKACNAMRTYVSKVDDDPKKEARMLSAVCEP